MTFYTQQSVFASCDPT